MAKRPSLVCCTEAAGETIRDLGKDGEAYRLLM
jgi:hypothetical protein